MTSLPLHALPPEAWAEVRAGDRVTRYHRAGTGSVVLLLHRPGARDALWPELPPALARGARVVTPELTPDVPDVADRLLGFLEGLGATGAGIVAAAPFCTAALELALRDGGPVTRAVLVPDDAEDDWRTRGAAVPLLVVGRALSATEAVPSIAGFVAGGG